mgnify:CR=1 FL=1
MSLDWLGPSVTLVLGVAAFFVGGANERRRDERLSAREQAARDADKAASELRRQLEEAQQTQAART